MWIKNATKQASNSTFKYRVGAVIVKSGRPVSTGYNIVNCYNPSRPFPTIHAEERAIVRLLRANRLDLLAGAKLYVSRVLRSGTTACSKPCSHCHSLAASVGIKEIIYTTNEGVERCKL